MSAWHQTNVPLGDRCRANFSVLGVTRGFDSYVSHHNEAEGLATQGGPVRTRTARRCSFIGTLAVAALLATPIPAGAAANVGGGAGTFTGNPAFAPTADDPTNPAIGAQGGVLVVTGPADRTLVLLVLRGLPGGRSFGAHVHRDPCSTSFGGPHYQAPDPMNPTPANADESHEVWLDFTTNPAGHARSLAVVPFEVLPGARSVIIHQGDHTMSGGAAGQRLACLDINV